MVEEMLELQEVVGLLDQTCATLERTRKNTRDDGWRLIMQRLCKETNETRALYRQALQELAVA